MEPTISPVLYSFLLFIGMLLMLEAGRYVGVTRRPKESEGERGTLGTIEGAAFALFGLLMAFTFSGAALRFAEKRMLVAEEANPIGTAYLRLDVVQDGKPELQELFRRYLDSRIETYRRMPNAGVVEQAMGNSRKLQHEIWSAAGSAINSPRASNSAGLVLPPALNNMIDITTRMMALQQHPPRIIYILLFALGLLCALLAGYRMSSGQRRSCLHILGFAIITVVIIYVMLDIEYPRVGLIRLETADQVLVDLRANMD